MILFPIIIYFISVFCSFQRTRKPTEFYSLINFKATNNRRTQQTGANNQRAAPIRRRRATIAGNRPNRIGNRRISLNILQENVNYIHQNLSE